MTPIYRDQYQIPFSSARQPSEYNRAVNLCRRFSAPYAEAVRLRDSGATPVCPNPTNRVRSTKGTGVRIPCPVCHEMHSSQGLHIHVKHMHPGYYITFMSNRDRLRPVEASA